jgi:DNA repair protein RadC
MHLQFLAEKREHFLAVLLDTKNRVLRTETISIGTLDSSLVHPREVYRVVVREGAACWIAVHNHPSGDPTPSPEDIAITKRLKDAGELLGVPLIDHLILGDGNYTSLRERGYL